MTMDVISSKQGDCPADGSVEVQLADLQEMHNQFREHIDSGLKILAENQAKGLPGAPDANAHPVADGQATPDESADSTLLAQHTEAEKLEQQVGQN